VAPRSIQNRGELFSNGRLTCKVLGEGAMAIFLQSGKAGYRNFTLSLDLGNASGSPSTRFGVVFREERRGKGKRRAGDDVGADDSGQFLYCLLSGTHSLLCVDGATGYAPGGPTGVLEGVKASYTRPEPVRMGGQRFPVDLGKLYHMAVRCDGNAFECYLNDQLVAEGTTGVAHAGRIGLLVHGGECVFDNVKLYFPEPLPDLTLLPGETILEEPDDPQEQPKP